MTFKSIFLFRWKLPLNPIKIPVFYYKANGHIPNTFIFEESPEMDVWGLPELEYPGLVKVIYKNDIFKKLFIMSIFLTDLFTYWSEY